MQILSVTKDTFRQEVLESRQTVLLDFWAGWCGPCRMLAPVLEEIAQEREDIKICKVDVDQAPELASQYGIVSIPTVLVVEQGQVKAKAVGLRSKNQLLDML